jgi:membrane-associated phospholipid phosphatase
MRAVVGLTLIAVSGLAVRRGDCSGFDADVRRRTEALRTPERDAFVRVATDLGSLFGVGVVAGALAAGGRSRLAVRVGLAGATAWTLAQATKPLLPRERPYQSDGAERLVVEPAGTSWPSGHAAVAAAMAITLGEGRGPAVRALLGSLATAVGISRVYVGVHHASDVVAGLGVGIVSAAALRPISRR